MLTLVEFQDTLPKNLKDSVDQNTIDEINRCLDSEEHAEYFRNNVLSYTKILTESRYKVTDYLNAVAFVTHKMCGCSDKEAYQKTFPTRYLTFISKGKTEKDISSSISIYKSTKLVTQLMEQSIIPLRIFNQDKRQLAIDTLVDVLKDAQTSAKSKVDAANVLLTHLADPKETGNVSVNVTTGSINIIEQLNATMNALAEGSRERIVNGESTTKAESNLLAVENLGG